MSGSPMAGDGGTGDAMYGAGVGATAQDTVVHIRSPLRPPYDVSVHRAWVGDGGRVQCL